jgi:hypothetical protein
MGYGQNLEKLYEEETKEKLRGACPKLAAMLEQYTGKCEAWAEALVNALETEGILAETVQVVPKYGRGEPCAEEKNQCMMLINNWSFGARGAGTFPYKPNEVIRGDGVVAQNNPAPPGYFWDHALVKAPVIGGSSAIYDPSYDLGPFLGLEGVAPGKEPTEESVLLEYQKAVIAGFCRPGFVLPGEEFPKPTECQQTPAGLQIVAPGGFSFP